jgi:four helix bundle protein
MQDFRKLRVWQLAHELALDVAGALSARACREFPGLRGQIVRAAGSVGSNIAEGCGKRSPQEFHRFLETALSSLLEMESQLLFARDASLLSAHEHHYLDQRAATLRRMLISLMQRVLDPASEPRRAAS